MAVVVQSFLGQTGYKIETTAGTYRAPTAAQDFSFYTIVKVEDIIDDILDQSFRGQAARDQGYYGGFRSARITITQPLAQLNSGHIFKAWLGQVATTGGADPFTQTFTELDAAPPTYSISVFDATITNTRAFTNCVLQKNTIKSGAKGLVTSESVWLGKFDVTTNAKPAAVYDTAPHYVPFEGAPTIAGSANTRMLDFQMIMEREVEVVPGFTGTQDISTVSGGRISVTGTMLFAPSDNTEIDQYRTNTQPTVSLLWTNTASHTLTIQMTKCAIINGSFLDQTAPFLKWNAKYQGINNATDTGPAKIVLLNSVGSGSYN